MPMYLICMLLYACIDLSIFHNGLTQTSILLIPFNLLGVQSIFMTASITQWWFISCLIMLYICFPLLNFLSIKLHNKFIMIISLAVISFYIYYIAKDILDFSLYYGNFFYRIPEFFAGIVAADLSRELRQEIIRWWHCAIGIIMFFCIMLFLFPIFEQEYNLYNIVIIPFFSFFLIACTNTKQGILERIGKSKVITWFLGQCLGIYICQAIIIILLENDVISVYNKQLAFPIMTMILTIIINIILKPFQRN